MEVDVRMESSLSAKNLAKSSALQLWLPRLQRLHAQRKQRRGIPSRQSIVNNNGLNFGCINASSISNKSAALCHKIADGLLDLLLITETWHEDYNDVAFRVTPAGYHILDIDIVRPLCGDANAPTDRARNTVTTSKSR